MRTLLIALTASSFASTFARLPRPEAPAPAELLPQGVSEWAGSYVCGQGVTYLALTLTREDDELRATFAFGPLAENPDVPAGAFLMTGFVDGAGVRLRPGEWLERPAHYVTVGLTGALDPAARELRGVIDSPYESCTTFVAHPIARAL